MMNLDYSNKWDKKCPQIKCRKDQCTGLTYVFIPATLGDDKKGSKVAPKNGAYCNAIVLYEADHAVYIYSKEGIPTKATSGYTFYNDILDRPFYNGEMMTSSTSIPKVPDAVSELTNDLNYQTKNDVDAAILVESTARELADQTLQGEIDTIVASSDVKDIVGTYAELQAYDTSTLGNNDIIKVLQDETHNDAETYYRWSTSTETFTYIGELGPFYTKSETDTLLSGKQDTLTAGTNITIAADNTISSKAQTIFYMNSSESGSTRHIYKKSDMTDPATSQEVFDANDLGQVILRISTSVDPASYSDAYLQNAYKATGDYQLLFLDEKTYRSFDVTDLSSSTFTYSSRVLQDQLTAGENINITGSTISAVLDDGIYRTTRTYLYVDGVNGSDSNAGTAPSAPLKTLDKAISRINNIGGSVDIRFISAGTYDLTGGVLDSANIVFEKYPSTLGDTTINIKTRSLTVDNSALQFTNFIITCADNGVPNYDRTLSVVNSQVLFSPADCSLNVTLQGSSFYASSGSTLRNSLTANYGSSVALNGTTLKYEKAITANTNFVSVNNASRINLLGQITVEESAYNPYLTMFSIGSGELKVVQAATFVSNATTKPRRFFYTEKASAYILDSQVTSSNALATNTSSFGSGTVRVAGNATLPYVAGSNISISGSTISGNYQPFTGTDGNTAGTAGLVPAPATTDAGKILGADGTWKAIDHTFETFTFTLVDNTVVTKNIAVEA